MKILIIGATGMIGHSLWIGLSPKHDVSVIIRKDKELLPDLPNIDKRTIYDQIDVLNFEVVQNIINTIKPDVVFNCIGIVKQLEMSNNHLTCIELNSLFPHRLAQACIKSNSRMIQFSSDCVFDGNKGQYVESDHPNATDLYGRTKALGEIDYLANVLTLRTSFIGREIFPHGGLVNWFESQKGKRVKGFANAIYSGLPTNTFVKILNDIILPNKSLNGIYHLSSTPIDKYTLLQYVNKALNLKVSVTRDESFVIDRSLNSEKFESTTKYTPPRWNKLIEELKVNSSFYEKINMNS
jgi:dTDP-4-dehydrorhamnose reductase